jgi:hypothetical protein
MASIAVVEILCKVRAWPVDGLSASNNYPRGPEQNHAVARFWCSFASRFACARGHHH